jgi:16S rRNA (cytidine1402-2'-O)-methyltransferase
LNTIDSPSLRQAAQAAAGGQQYPAGTLYVVATPIGNLADISLRAIHVLGLVDVVACEDTRQSAVLLRHLGLHKPLIALHQHNEQSAAGSVLARLAAGERVAYVSDAGTPAVSDPGAVLVARAAEAGHRVLPIPGASSTVTLLSVAGDHQARGFAFAGFLPTKAAERRARLQAVLGQAESTQVLFEAPHRIEDLVGLLAELAPQRRITLGRELTKQFETVHTALAAELPVWLAADPQRQRGEFAIAVHAETAAPSDAALGDEPLRVLKLLMAELPLKQAVSLASQISGAPRNALYEAGLTLKREADA